MNRRQLRIVAVAALAVGSVSLASAVFPSAIGAQTQSVSSGVFVDGNTTLEDPPGPSGLNLSDTPWLQAYYQFFEPPDGSQNATAGGADGPGGGPNILPVLAAVGSAVTVLTGLGAVVWVRWLWTTPELGDPRDTPDEDATTTATRPVPPGDLDPSNEVYRAWFEMVSRLEVSGADTMTPRELSRSAIEQGFDREAVASLTQAFEQVRYGTTTASSERESRAQAALGRLTGEDDERLTGGDDP